MNEKTSSEVQDIFGFSRDDIKRLESIEVVKPEKRGQGRASIFGEEAINRLLDVKLYILAGYRISDMESIFSNDHDPQDMISEQIHIYKKRIQMLEFIQAMRADDKELAKLDERQLIELDKLSVKNNHMPEFGTIEYHDKVLDLLKLIFIVDFLSQKDSFRADISIVRQRSMTALNLILGFFELTGEDDTKEKLLRLVKEPIDDDLDIKDIVKDFSEEWLAEKDKILEELTNDIFESIPEEVDEQVVSVYKMIVLHLSQFVADYFFDEHELYCIFINLRNLFKELDQDALDKGKIKLRKSH